MDSGPGHCRFGQLLRHAIQQHDGGARNQLHLPYRIHQWKWIA